MAPQSVVSAVVLAMMGKKGVAHRARCSTPLRKLDHREINLPSCDSDNKGDFLKKVSSVI